MKNIPLKVVSKKIQSLVQSPTTCKLLEPGGTWSNPCFILFIILSICYYLRQDSDLQRSGVTPKSGISY